MITPLERRRKRLAGVLTPGLPHLPLGGLERDWLLLYLVLLRVVLFGFWRKGMFWGWREQYGYVGCAQTTLNKVGRTPIPAAWLPRVQAQSPGEDRSLVIGLAGHAKRPAHLLVLAPEDISEAISMLERYPSDAVRHAVWRRFNRHCVQITPRERPDRDPEVVAAASGA